jgi:UDP-3-O-[3-hydroxymyristoyl] glucosamine N-acyltransferase
VTITQTLSELAQLVGGEVLGDGEVEISGVAPIEHAGPGEITFVTHPKYRSFLADCKASAVIISREAGAATSALSGQSYLCVTQPYVALAKILQHFSPRQLHDGRVSPMATVHESARLASNVTVFPQVYIGPEAAVGEGCILYPGVFVGDGAVLGEHCVLHPKVTIGERCRIGNRVVLHAGVVVGSDGFGFTEDGTERIKIPQVGVVEIDDDVEIGANSTVDRATLGKTMIGRGTKIDNLVHIAHNVVIGEQCLIIAQAGIAGSTRLGPRVILAGQVGILNHLEIGEGAMIGPQSGVAHSVAPYSVLSSGLPAAPHKQWLRVLMVLPRLPELLNKLRALEKKVSGKAQKKNKGAKTHA